MYLLSIQEKTHFAIKITNEEVFVILQHKSGGMTIKHIVSYLKHFYRNYNNEYNKKNNITYNQLASDNFEEILKNMNDIKLAEITIDKKILSTSSVNYSDITSEIQDNIVLTAKNKKGKNLNRFANYIYTNKFGKKDDGISRIRIKGKDIDDNNVIFDTDFLSKITNIQIERNVETGEFQSESMLTELRKIAEDL